jgi:uncharacterized protein
MAAGAPRSAAIHLFESDGGYHLFIANGSRLFDIEPGLFARLGAAISTDRVEELLSGIGASEPRLIDDAPLQPPTIHALSLAVAQKCNLGCTYCYAQQGAFGGQAKNMPLAIANRAVDLLLSEAGDGGKATLAFLGGEPLVNRPVVRAVTRRAAELAWRRGIALSFSITTNGTLLNEADAAFFETYGFAVTISLDGPRETHDRLRPYKSGAAMVMVAEDGCWGSAAFVDFFTVTLIDGAWKITNKTFTHYAGKIPEEVPGELNIGEKPTL